MMKKRPPFLLHILAAFFIVAFLINLAGIIQSVESWNWLIAAGYHPHPVYLVFKNAFLALANLAAAVLLWARCDFSPLFSQLLAGITFAWFWVDRLLLTRNQLPFKEHTFALFASLLLLAFVLLSSWLLEPFMRGQMDAEDIDDDNGVQNEQIDA